MMENKFVKLLIFAVFVIVSGVIYQEHYRPAEYSAVEPSGRTVELNMRIEKDSWSWNPTTVTVEAGDKVILHIYNDDSYDHGFGLEVFGINDRLFPKRETTIEFIASKAGEFNFFCSVPCGEGHFRQTGKLIVTPQMLERQ